MPRWFAVLVVAAVGCAPRPNLDAERTAILAADSAWLASARTQNVDSIVSFWSEDARVIGPGQAPIVGRAGIRAMVEEGLRTPGFSVSWQTSDVVVAPSGDVAWSFGPNRFTVPNAAGRIDTLLGNSVVVWRKGSDGRWRSVVDTWTPQPPPAAAAAPR